MKKMCRRLWVSGFLCLSAGVHASGTIQGTVTDEMATPLSSGSVVVYQFAGPVDSAAIGPDGTYSTSVLPDGQYFLHTVNDAGFIDEVYDDQPCGPFDCGSVVTGGQPVNVAGGAQVGIDFQLAAGGRVSGNVQAGGSPADEGFVCVYQPNGVLTGVCGATDNSGDYLTDQGLPDGSYVVLGNPGNDGFFLSELFDNVPFENFDFDAGTRVVISGGTDVSGVDFDLPQGGKIQVAAELASNSSPVDTGVLFVTHPDGSPAAQLSYENGVADTTAALSPGSYRAIFSADDPSGLVSQIFVNGTNIDCSVGECFNLVAGGAGSLITVTAGGTTGIAFQLNAGVSISGNVTQMGSALESADVCLFDEFQSFVGGCASTNASGDFLIDGLAAGEYRAQAFFPGGFTVPEWFMEQPDFASADPITVGASAVTGIDFTLDTEGGRIHGEITNGMGSPISQPVVEVFNSSGQFVTTAFPVVGPENYETDALPAGDYYLRIADGTDPFNLPMVFGGSQCLDVNLCDPLSGTAVTVVAGQFATADDQLSRGGRIRGFAVDSSFGVIFPEPGVEIYDASDVLLGVVPTDPLTGAYQAMVLPGMYKVASDADPANHVNEFFDGSSGFPCPVAGCASVVAGADTVTVTAGSTRDFVDLVLDPVAAGGSFTISGQVTDSSTDLPLAGVDVFQARITQMGLDFAGITQTDGDGNYTLPVVPDGNYRVNFFKNGFTSEQYGAGANGPILYCDIDNFCDQFAFRPVTVAGSDVTGIDGSLEPAGSISGEVTDINDNQIDLGFLGVQIKVFDSRGRFIATALQQSGLGYGIRLPPGEYRLLAVTNGGSFIDTAFGDIPCSRCDIVSTAAVTIDAPGDANENIDIRMMSGSRISGSVTIDGSGDPVAGADVFIYNDSGIQVAMGTTNVSGFWQTGSGLADGDYFVATFSERNRTGLVDVVSMQPPLVDELYDDQLCIHGCDYTTGTAVALDQADIGGINIAVSPGGLISGQVQRAGNLAPVKGMPVTLFDSGDNELATVRTDMMGEYRIGPVPAGSYKVVAFGQTRGLSSQVFGASGSCLPDLCDDPAALATGSPVNVIAEQTETNIDFILTPGQLITVDDLQNQDSLGASVAVCGSRVLVGVPGAESPGGAESGAIYVYQRQGAGYELSRRIFPPDGRDGDRFGADVACSGGMFVVGSPGDGPTAKGPGDPNKAAYVYNISGFDSSPLQTLLASNLGNDDDSGFGMSVALDGNTLAVGAPNSSLGGGAVSVFTFNSVTTDPWNQEVVLMDPFGSSGDGFGSSLDVSDGMVMIGAPNQANDSGITSGVAQLFENLTGTSDWGNIGKFSNADGSAGDGFGTAVALDGVTLAVGSPGDDTAGTDAGTAFLYTFSGNNLSLITQLMALDASGGDQLGTSIDISGGTVAIGASFADGNVLDSGAAYLFTNMGGLSWLQTDKYFADNGAAGDLLGQAIALNGSSLVIGSPNADSASTDGGSALVITDESTIFQGDFE